MKRKITVSFLIMALVCCLIGGATFAYFTDTAANAANTFSSGTVDLALLNDTNNTSAVVNAAGGNGCLAPGDTITGSFVIDNEGTLDMWYQVVPTLNGTIFAVDDPQDYLTVNYYINNTLVTDPGSWKTFAANADNVTFSYEISLASAAGNAFAGKNANIQFTVNAQQVKNNSTPGTITYEQVAE